jgi:uracil phosphoribosyltransferase/phosphoserine phosphatase/adenylate kinase
MSDHGNGIESVPMIRETSVFHGESKIPENHHAHMRRPVIGLYGIPGSGKTTLLGLLQSQLEREQFVFYESSQVIGNLVEGGLEAFRSMGMAEKKLLRERAIELIGSESSKNGKTAIVTGHFMFWPEEQDVGELAWTTEDAQTYTHILYLDAAPKTVEKQCLDDTHKKRSSSSVTHLRKWQQAEKDQLRDLCYQHSILFARIPYPGSLDKVMALILDFHRHKQDLNQTMIEAELDKAFISAKGVMETVLVLDADKTLAQQDSGVLFWEKYLESIKPVSGSSPLKKLFSNPSGYSYYTFRQAMLLYEETVDQKVYDLLCQHVASVIVIHPEFVSLLKKVAEHKHVGAVVVTCGLRRVWEKVLEAKGLLETVKVIGSGPITDGFVVTGLVKAALVARLQKEYQALVYAFGDSPVDIDMLKKADQAIVVVGEEGTRSVSMEDRLIKAIQNEGFEACQVIFPNDAPLRVNTTKLPVIDITGKHFLDSVFCRRKKDTTFPVYYPAITNAIKLLTTPMRDAGNSGPSLRRAHGLVGWYLAIEVLVDLIDVEEYQIQHVLDRPTLGYRFKHESHILIVALMRGGEPMALGVSEALPAAMFLHAKNPEDIKLSHIQDCKTIVLVDSVINTGKTIVDFVTFIRKIHATVRIVVVAGTVQVKSISGLLSEALSSFADVSLVALRTSETKFVGSYTTDTGNRLFNTTHLP